MLDVDIAQTQVLLQTCWHGRFGFSVILAHISIIKHLIVRAFVNRTYSWYIATKTTP